MIIGMQSRGDKTIVTARSLITQKVQTMIINTTIERIKEWRNGKVYKPIQSALSELTNGEREFLITGITPEEWTEHVATSKTLYCPKCKKNTLHEQTDSPVFEFAAECEECQTVWEMIKDWKK